MSNILSIFNAKMTLGCTKRFLLPLLTALILVATIPGEAFALPESHYATSSKLASGKWAKVQVSESGMQFLSNAMLRKLGFDNPDKVNVYGFGGRMLPELLNSSMPDDLPAIPSIRTPGGIVFFGHSTVSWSPAYSSMAYEHSLNPYSESAFYFISDIDNERKTTPESPAVSSDSEPMTVFTERTFHELDLTAPSTSGRILLGEDFRTQSTRSFLFNLPDNVGDAKVKVVFGAKVSNGQSSLTISANGNQLPATKSDNIPGVGSLETFLVTTATEKTVTDPGEKLNLSIKYSYSGAIYTAALDYIEVEYPRRLSMPDDELYFYISPSSPSNVRIEGCSETMVLWDVTDPVNPASVAYKLDGTSALFTTPAGYREYVAFNPAKISRTATAAGLVANQDIHSMETPDMVIIAPAAFMKAAQRVADLHHATDSLKVAVLLADHVYNEFSSGAPDVTAFRKLLKMWYDRSIRNGKRYARYCLLFSRPTYDNKMLTPVVKRSGYPRLPIWQSPKGFSSSTSFSTDDYIGMLNDNTREMKIGSEPIHVAVGRMPVKSVNEAEIAVAKLEKYVKDPNLGSWRNNVMVIADDQDNGDHLTQAEKVIAGMKSTVNGSKLLYERLYLDSYPLKLSSTGATYPLAKERMMYKINEGVALINYIGHANPREWGHEKLLTWTDLTGMTNTNLPFIYAATCEFLNWDDDAVSGAEEMWLNPSAGIIGMICPSRKVYIPQNGILNANTAPFMFRGARVGDFMIEGKNKTLNDDDNKLRYGLMGDPALKLPAPALSVSLDSIGGNPVGSGSELTVLKARSDVSISGKVVDAEGNPATGFNGVLDLQLFDAEKVITTYGNGEKGKVVTYNDRKTRLLVSKATVKDGKWETRLLIPSEIENNFSPAMLSFYACDDKGLEANGTSEDFIIYGYNENASDDVEGPEISAFYLNSPSFSDGDVVGPAPVIFAEFSDPSGINLSEAGIGHGMTLTLDGETVYEDVAIRYTPDTETIGKGSISYPLDGIAPGTHKLDLTVWDNANNSSSSSLTFNVKAGWLPSISNLSTDVSPAVSSVSFIVSTDGTIGTARCRIDVFDLSGRKIWTADADSPSVGQSSVNIGWDLKDFSGHRVARGIYLYRATIITAEGAEITKTNKLAVAAG